jgi:hypothetical protein
MASVNVIKRRNIDSTEKESGRETMLAKKTG